MATGAREVQIGRVDVVEIVMPILVAATIEACQRRTGVAHWYVVLPPAAKACRSRDFLGGVYSLRVRIC